MISCREICKLYFWCNDITLFSPYDFYNASKSTFATDVVGCLCQLEASNFGFAPGPKNHRAGPVLSLPRRRRRRRTPRRARPRQGTPSCPHRYTLRLESRIGKHVHTSTSRSIFLHVFWGVASFPFHEFLIQNW